MKLKDACSWKESYGNLDCILKSKDITLPTKVHMVKAMVFPVVMYRYEIWTIKKAECQRIDAFIVVLEKTLEESLGLKGESVNLKGNQSWIFIHDAEAEAPIFWPPGMKNRLTGKDPDAGKDWRPKEKRVVG